MASLRAATTVGTPFDQISANEPQIWSWGRAVKCRQHAAQLVTPERLEAIRAAAEALPPEEMQRRSRMKRRRRQHDLETWTEPTRTQAALIALYGSPGGYPMTVLDEFAVAFVDELRNGQKGVYARLGCYWGVEWPTARSRVLAAVRRGALVWTGSGSSDQWRKK